MTREASPDAGKRDKDERRAAACVTKSGAVLVLLLCTSCVETCGRLQLRRKGARWRLVHTSMRCSAHQLPRLIS